jgi:predicted dehydrogenase
MKEMKRFLSPRSQEAVVHYRVNAGYIPLTHWTQDIEQGGGRLIGEVCHFIDTITFLLDALPVRVSVHALPDRQTYNGDNLVLRFLYPDGSIGLITYLANGDKSIPKERIEVFCGGKVAILDDFRRLELAKGGRHRVIRSVLRQDKGHLGEVEEFVRCIRMGGDPPIPYHEILGVSWATLMAHQALSSGIDEEISYSVLG